MIICGIDFKMEEDELAAKVHGVYISDSDNSENGNSDFDEEYEALKPPTISLKDRQQDVIKITAFKVISHKNNKIKSICSKLNVNSKKPIGVASKCQKNWRDHVSNGKCLQHSQDDHKKVTKKLVKVCSDTKESKQFSSLNSDFSLSAKSKCDESCITNLLNKENGVIDYASAVIFKNYEDRTLPMMNGNKDAKKQVNKRSNVKHKKIKAKKEQMGTNTSILSTNDFQNKLIIRQ